MMEDVLEEENEDGQEEENGSDNREDLVLYFFLNKTPYKELRNKFS